MKEKVVILIAEDDDGHARLIEKNLARAEVTAPRHRFSDGQQILDFLFHLGRPPHCDSETAYLLLLDIRMPKVDGTEVLRQLKGDPELRKIPVIMLTTTEDPREVTHCHELGCNSYIVKPVDYDKFADAIQKLGTFINLAQIPSVAH